MALLFVKPPGSAGPEQSLSTHNTVGSTEGALSLSRAYTIQRAEHLQQNIEYAEPTQSLSKPAQEAF